MIRFPIFLAPLVLLLVGAAPIAPSGGMATAVGARDSAKPWRPPLWQQVRIEQSFSIRITPGAASLPPAVTGSPDDAQHAERVERRNIGKCLAINTIAAVRPGDHDELLLFLHDQRIVSATLEKRCNARDFYSGFYLERNSDAAICSGRDMLHSRSGANCKVRRLHELVPTGYRRFP